MATRAPPGARRDRPGQRPRSRSTPGA